MRAQKMSPKERVKVRTWEGRNVTVGAGEVRGDRFLVMTFVGIQKGISLSVYLQYIKYLHK
jgi:hypothetical protein